MPADQRLRSRSGTARRREYARGYWLACQRRDRSFWVELMARTGGCCYLCGHRIDGAGVWRGLSVDHITPRSRGGSNSVDNVAAVHVHCNNSKGPRLPEEFWELETAALDCVADDAPGGFLPDYWVAPETSGGAHELLQGRLY